MRHGRSHGILEIPDEAYPEAIALSLSAPLNKRTTFCTPFPTTNRLLCFLCVPNYEFSRGAGEGRGGAVVAKSRARPPEPHLEQFFSVRHQKSFHKGEGKEGSRWGREGAALPRLDAESLIGFLAKQNCNN